MNIDSTKIVANKYWPLIMLFIGMIMILFQSVGFDLTYMPGDFGDGRLNNYILEHGYRWVVNIETSYWDAPFMFPEHSIIAYSDNHFGSLPLYIPLRFLFDRETSYQLWYLFLIVLNYLCCFYALRKLKISMYASSMGAFIYAFSALMILQSGHVQLLPRFAAPLAIVHFYLWMQNKNNKNLYWASILLVYQFYCAIYLGFFLMYVLGVLFLVYVLVERKLDVFKTLIENKRSALQTGVIFIFLFILMCVLLYPYYLQSIDKHAYPPKEALLGMIPRVWSFFYSSGYSIVWGSISSHINSIIPQSVPEHEHQLYIGIVPYVLFIAACILYRKNYTMKFFLVSVVVFLVATISIYDYSIYGVLSDYIPGARAIRAFSRYMVVIVFLWSIIVALFIDYFFSNMGVWKAILLFVIPVLLFIENLHYPHSRVCSKNECKERCNHVVELYNKNKSFTKKIEAFSYQVRSENMYEVHVDAMMASQLVNMPCVNAYTSHNPLEYNPYFSEPTTKNLELWLTSERVRKQTGRKISSESILILE